MREYKNNRDKSICIDNILAVRNFISKAVTTALSVFVRNPDKFGDMDLTGVNVIQGDALNAEAVEKTMEGQKIMLCSLEGDVLTMAKNIIAALEKTSVKRISWISGMGIHHEITGVRGIMLNMLAKQRPEYIEAADVKNMSVSWSR